MEKEQEKLQVRKDYNPSREFFINLHDCVASNKNLWSFNEESESWKEFE